MATITFSSPSMKKDKTVYAVAGDRGTLLKVAQEHKIPIPFDCQDGECGSCLVKVTILSAKTPMGVDLTDKEREVLTSLGKLSKKELEDADVKAIPPHHRLACQFQVRDEDIAIHFEGNPA